MSCTTPIVSLAGFENLLDILKWAIFEKKVYGVYFTFLISNERNSVFFLGKLQLNLFHFCIPHTSWTPTPFLFVFEQLPDALK